MTPEEQQERVRSSFAKQGLMTTLGATLGSVSPGMVEIALQSPSGNLATARVRPRRSCERHRR